MKNAVYVVSTSENPSPVELEEFLSFLEMSLPSGETPLKTENQDENS